jgi:hypothetical protein
MSSLTGAGKLRKSRLEDPIQCNAAVSRRLPGRVALSDYPSFGIIAQGRVNPCTSVESEPVEPQL